MPYMHDIVLIAYVCDIVCNIHTIAGAVSNVVFNSHTLIR